MGVDGKVLPRPLFKVFRLVSVVGGWWPGFAEGVFVDFWHMLDSCF